MPLNLSERLRSIVRQAVQGEKIAPDDARFLETFVVEVRALRNHQRAALKTKANFTEKGRKLHDEHSMLAACHAKRVDELMAEDGAKQNALGL